jgi:hypothetical protein
MATEGLLDLRRQHKALMGALKDDHDTAELRSFTESGKFENVLVGLHLAENYETAELYEFLRPCAESVVEGGIPAEWLESSYFVLALYLDNGCTAVPIASLSASFRPSPTNTVVTHYESVHSDFRGRGYGGLLFDMLHLVVQYMSVNDGFMSLNLRGQESLPVHVYVDETDPVWHVGMLERRGYERLDEMEDGAQIMEKVFYL